MWNNRSLLELGQHTVKTYSDQQFCGYKPQNLKTKVELADLSLAGQTVPFPTIFVVSFSKLLCASQTLQIEDCFVDRGEGLAAFA